MIYENILEQLKNYTKKNNIAITSNGNDAIFKAFEILKREGCKNILFPDQAGWWKCPDIAKKVGLEFSFLETKDGMVDIDLLGKFDGDYDSLYICSLGGYYVEQPLFEIYQVCKDNNCLLIVDACSGIGVDGLCNVGDIILGSFGRWKIVDYGNYGFIASNFDFDFNSLVVEDFSLLKKLKNAYIRFNFLVSLNFEIKKELNNFKVYFPESRSLNVVVEKNEWVLEYCNRKGYEYKLCPVYNRINKDAISIEVKRLNFGESDGK